MDLFPTLAHACGVEVKLPKGAQKMDGVNVWGTLINNFYKHPRSELLYWHGKGAATAIRVGDWKLVFNGDDQNPKDPPFEKPRLYNLADDPKESKDLSVKHPKKAEELLARAKVLLSEIYDNQLPLGTWEGVEAPEPPLKAEDVWGEWVK